MALRVAALVCAGFIASGVSAQSSVTIISNVEAGNTAFGGGSRAVTSYQFEGFAFSVAPGKDVVFNWLQLYTMTGGSAVTADFRLYPAQSTTPPYVTTANTPYYTRVTPAIAGSTVNTMQYINVTGLVASSAVSLNWVLTLGTAPGSGYLMVSYQNVGMFPTTYLASAVPAVFSNVMAGAINGGNTWFTELSYKVFALRLSGYAVAAAPATATPSPMVPSLTPTPSPSSSAIPAVATPPVAPTANWGNTVFSGDQGGAVVPNMVVPMPAGQVIGISFVIPVIENVFKLNRLSYYPIVAGTVQQYANFTVALYKLDDATGLIPSNAAPQCRIAFSDSGKPLSGGSAVSIDLVFSYWPAESKSCIMDPRVGTRWAITMASDKPTNYLAGNSGNPAYSSGSYGAYTGAQKSLDNGVTWQPMTSGDIRPLLTLKSAVSIPPTPTPTATAVSATSSMTASATRTGSETATATRTGSYTQTSSPSISLTQTVSASIAPSFSPTAPATMSPSSSVPPSFTATVTGTAEPSKSAGASSSQTPESTASPTMPASPSSAETPTETRTAAATESSSVLPSSSSTVAPSASASMEPSTSSSATGTATSTGSPTGTGTLAPSSSETASTTGTAEPSASSAETASPSAGVSASESPSAAVTTSPTSAATSPAAGTPSPSAEPTQSPTPTASASTSASASSTPGPVMAQVSFQLRFAGSLTPAILPVNSPAWTNFIAGVQVDVAAMAKRMFNASKITPGDITVAAQWTAVPSRRLAAGRGLQTTQLVASISFLVQEASAGASKGYADALAAALSGNGAGAMLPTAMGILSNAVQASGGAPGGVSAALSGEPSVMPVTAPSNSPAPSGGGGNGGSSGSGSGNTGAIVGGVIGGICAVGLVVGFFVWRSKRATSSKQANKRTQRAVSLGMRSIRNTVLNTTLGANSGNGAVRTLNPLSASVNASASVGSDAASGPTSPLASPSKPLLGSMYSPATGTPRTSSTSERRSSSSQAARGERTNRLSMAPTSLPGMTGSKDDDGQAETW